MPGEKIEGMTFDGVQFVVCLYNDILLRVV